MLRGCKQRATQKGSTLRRCMSLLFRQLSLSNSARKISRDLTTASPSCRQSARKRRGTITPMTRISQRYGFLYRSNITVFQSVRLVDGHRADDERRSLWSAGAWNRFGSHLGYYRHPKKLEH